MIKEVETICPIANSDHNLISFQLVIGSMCKEDESCNYSYSRTNFNELQKSIANVQWVEEFNGKSVNEMWNILKNVLITNRNLYVPKAKSYKRHYPKWMTNGIKRSIKKRNKAWQKYKDKPEYQNLMNYRKRRNEVTNRIRINKRKFEEKLAEKIKIDSKSFYLHARLKTKTKDSVGSLVNSNNSDKK